MYQQEVKYHCSDIPIRLAWQIQNIDNKFHQISYIYMIKQNNYNTKHFLTQNDLSDEQTQCQRPSLLSNLNNFKSQSPSSGLVISQSSPFTCAIRQLAANPVDIPEAISIGVDIHFLPSFTAPSGKVTLDEIVGGARGLVGGRQACSGGGWKGSLEAEGF